MYDPGISVYDFSLARDAAVIAAAEHVEVSCRSRGRFLCSAARWQPLNYRRQMSAVSTFVCQRRTANATLE